MSRPLVLLVACACAHAPRTVARPGPASPLVRIQLAEALATLAERTPNYPERLGDAAAAFDAVAQDTGQPETTRKQAAQKAVEWWMRTLMEEGKRAGSSDDDEALEIPYVEQHYLAAAQRYLTYLPPADDEHVRLEFQIAQLYWRHQHDAEAQPFLEEILKTQPGHEVAEGAARLLLHLLIRQKRYQELEVWVGAMQAEPALSGLPELGETLRSLRDQIDRKEAERQEQAGDYAGCGATYLDLEKRAPKGEDADELLWDAAICFMHAGDAKQQKAALRRLIKLHPKSPLAGKARQALKEMP